MYEVLNLTQLNENRLYNTLGQIPTGHFTQESSAGW